MAMTEIFLSLKLNYTQKTNSELFFFQKNQFDMRLIDVLELQKKETTKKISTRGNQMIPKIFKTFLQM